MQKYIIFLILGLFGLHGMAQTNTFSGIVLDSKTGETLIGATVLVKDTNPKGTATNANGFFSLPGIESPTVVVVVSFIGYEAKEFSINFATEVKVFKEIKLSPLSVELGEIEVIELSANRVSDREIEVSEHRLTPKMMQSIPTARNDVFKAIRFLPGIEGTEPLSPLVSVRGSDPGENLIMLDGVTMYNPYHFISSSGIFNMQTVKNVDMMVGGFGAEYGGRNSSVINIATKDGNKNGVHGEVRPSTVESAVFVEFPLDAKTTMMVAGRVNYDIVGNFIFNSNNYFYDANLSLTHHFNNRNRIDLKYFTSKDHTSMNFNTLYKYIGNTVAQFGDTLVSQSFKTMNFIWENKWRNNIATAIWKSVLAPNLYFRVQAYASLHGANNYTAFKMDVEDIVFNTSTRFKSKVNDYTVKASLNYTPFYWNELKLGAEYSNYLFANASQINGIDGASAQSQPNLIAYFADDKIKWGNLVLRPGVRISNFDQKQYYFEPRMNLVYAFSNRFKAKAAYGKYYQYVVSMNTQELEFNQFLDYYYPLNKVKPSLSYHYIVGFEQRIGKHQEFSADVYYKELDRTYIFDLLQSQFEAFALSDKLYAGKGETYGVELLWRGQINRLSGWASYTLARSNRTYPNIMQGKTYLYDYDHLHTIKGVLNFQATERIAYSTDFLFQSGVPRSVENSLQMFYMYEPLSGQMIYSPQFTIDQKNSSRMPWTMTINMGLEKQIVKGFGKDIANFFNADESSFVLKVQNLLFLRRNVIYYLPVMGFGRYFPFGMGYYPSVSAGYSIKF